MEVSSSPSFSFLFLFLKKECSRTRRERDPSTPHGDRGIFIFPVQLTTSRIGNLTRLIHTLLYVMTIHTYIHTCVYHHSEHTTQQRFRIDSSLCWKFSCTNPMVHPSIERSKVLIDLLLQLVVHAAAVTVRQPSGGLSLSTRRGVAVVELPWRRHQQPYTAGEGGEGRGKESWWSCLVCVCVCVCIIYVGWRELWRQHDSPRGVTTYLRAARAAAWRSLCLSFLTSPSAF